MFFHSITWNPWFIGFTLLFAVEHSVCRRAAEESIFLQGLCELLYFIHSENKRFLFEHYAFSPLICTVALPPQFLPHCIAMFLQTKHWLLTGPLVFFTLLILFMFKANTIWFVAICNLPSKCHWIPHTGALKLKSFVTRGQWNTKTS